MSQKILTYGTISTVIKNVHLLLHAPDVHLKNKSQKKNGIQTERLNNCNNI